MIPASIDAFFAANQEALWLTTLLVDLGFTIMLFRLFGKSGLQVAVATAVILANLQGPKLTVIFGLETSLGVIFYCGIFFATDVLSENYGKAAAAKAVWMGFAVSIVVVVMMTAANLYQPVFAGDKAAYSVRIHDAFATITSFTPLFVFASLTAYVVSQRFDVWAFHKIKSLTGERWLWLRNNGSTLSSQVIDTAIFTLLAWAPIVGIKTALALGFAKYVFKLVIAAIDTVFIYWARYAFLHRRPLME